MKMKTSVIMTVYNGSKYLLEMLESLRKQTRAIDELLIFDDRSTDSSQMIIKTYISKYRLNNWKLVVNKENKGWEKNFTDGISTATGDIIFPCDQDDIWHLDKIAVDRIASVIISIRLDTAYHPIAIPRNFSSSLLIFHNVYTDFITIHYIQGLQ